MKENLILIAFGVAITALQMTIAYRLKALDEIKWWVNHCKC